MYSGLAGKETSAMETGMGEMETRVSDETRRALPLLPLFYLLIAGLLLLAAFCEPLQSFPLVAHLRAAREPVVVMAGLLLVLAAISDESFGFDDTDQTR